MLRTATLTAALAALAALAPAASAQAPTVTVSADVSSNTTWTSNNVYLLDGLIYVRPGATLTIQPGTIIKGREVPSGGTGDLASGLVVMVDADINANGTAQAPIILTAEADNVSDPNDLDQDDRALWGGLIVLGRATTNSTPGINNVEGIPASNDTRFGCDGSTFACDDDDNSGTLRYVSVRHGGFGFEPDSEINGMTFGAVGRGTTVEYVEVFANSDDAFEFFGGTVRAKYLVGAFNGDDTFDTDRGFRGAFQFGFSVNSPGNDAGRCFENDGGVSDLGGEDATPFSIPVYSNITCIGAGEDADDGQLGEDSNSSALQLRDNTGGKIYNSIFADFPGSAIDIEALSSGEDTENRLGQNTEADDLTIRNNIFFAFDAGVDADNLVDNDSDNSAARQAEIETLIASANSTADPQIIAYGTRNDNDMTLDPRPATTGAAATGADFTFAALDAFFTEVAYLGAFAPATDSGDNVNTVWAKGWTALSQNNYFSAVAVPGEAGPTAVRSALAVGPNPASRQATVRLTLDAAQDVTVAVYDALGRQVALLAQGTLAAGETALAFPASALPAGVYVVRAQGETVALTQQISVVR